EQTLDEPNIVLLRIINTRWLSLSNVVSNLHRILDSVKIALQEDSSKSADYITISEVYTHLKATIDTITTQYIGRNGMPPNYENFLKEYIDEQGILFEELPDFISQFAIATIESLQDRFPDSEILNSLRIFDPRELPPQYNQIHSYGNNEIKTLVKFYGKPKNFCQIEYQPIIDESEIFDWEKAYNYWITKDRRI
ncbi:1786_t:CDS:2, partial [Dentiscutata heterogama]